MDLSSLPPSPERSVSAVGSESKVTNGVEGKTPNGVEDKATNGVEDVQNLQEEQRLKDPNLVAWKGDDDPENPKNWAIRKKWLTAIPLSLFNLMGAMSSSATAPALGSIQRDLNMSSALAIMSLSVFLLGTAITPLFTAPLSEIYGRLKILQATNLFYILFNTLCGIATTKEQLIVFRFLAGVGGSGPQAIGSGINGDLFRAHERGKAVAVYTIAPLLGSVIGPIAGGFLVQYVSWRWCFYLVSILSGVVQLVGFFVFNETYPPILLQHKCKKLRKESGNQGLYTEWERDHPSFPALLASSLARPFRLIFTQPIVQVLSIYIAYLNGILYLIVATFPQVWSNIYGESISIGSLNYISITVGMFISVQVGVRMADKVYKQLCAKNTKPRPEFRLPVLMAGSCIVPIGIFWYAWSARPSVNWIMPNIGAAIFSGGMLLQSVCIQGYLIDTYATYAASAMASVTVLKSLLGFGLPLAAPGLYDSLGFAWGNSLLAFIAIVIGIPAPIGLWFFGPFLRNRSNYAQG